MMINRRTMLMESALGFGSLALAAMLDEHDSPATAADSNRFRPHHAPTAKNIIFLFMSGAPGQTDTFDPKPLLNQMDLQAIPESIAATIPNIPRSGSKSKLFASPWKFQKHGESGIEVSSLFPNTAQLVDDLCVVRSMNHRVPVHGPGECIALTGTGIGDRPSIGSWMNYGLGSANKELPGFVVMLTRPGDIPPQLPGWGSGFLPAQFQGTVVDATTGVPFTDMPDGYDRTARRQQLDFIGEMNRSHLKKFGTDSELEARIASYELGYRMQTSAPEMFDVSDETAQTRAMYGLDEKETGAFGMHCLLARRLVERGVRCVQLRNGGWDSHSKLELNHSQCAKRTDLPIAGLLRDLKQRGLLDSTLVVWGGEFGRTPTSEGSRKSKSRGRDHSPAGYTMWLAGGGVQGGQIIGATDELGYVPIERPLSPADMHATMLHALGLDQHQLIYQHNNRDEIPTVFGGEVIHEVFG